MSVITKNVGDFTSYRGGGVYFRHQDASGTAMLICTPPGDAWYVTYSADGQSWNQRRLAFT